MVSPLLRAKRLWYGGDPAGALRAVEDVLGRLELSPETLAARAGLPFEAFLVGLLDDVPIAYGDALGRLWAALPGRYALDALQLRRDLDPGDLEWLYAAAADGLLSSAPEDHDRVARVVLPEALPDAVDRARLELLMESAQAAGAWESFVDGHRDLVASLLLDYAFHAVRVMHASMVLDRLDRVAEEQPELLDPVAGALADWPEEDVGLGPGCARELVDALRARDFDALGPECLPD